MYKCIQIYCLLLHQYKKKSIKKIGKTMIHLEHLKRLLYLCLPSAKIVIDN